MQEIENLRVVVYTFDGFSKETILHFPEHFDTFAFSFRDIMLIHKNIHHFGEVGAVEYEILFIYQLIYVIQSFNL